MGPRQVEVITNQDIAVEQFLSAFGERLDKRVRGFECAVAHVFENSDCPLPQIIIETGTARETDNWSGDGQSTLIWDWCAARRAYTHVVSIDLSPEAIAAAQAQTKLVEYKTGDSLAMLAAMDPAVLNKCKLLYLDSFDWSYEKNAESSLHHMFELALVYQALPKGCMIMVDDCHTQDLGKHVVVRMFFDKLGKRPVFEAYQTAWVK